MTLTAVLLSIILIATGMIIGWKLENINGKLDTIIDQVTDYQALLDRLDFLIGHNDWDDIIVNGQRFNRGEIEKKASEQLLTSKTNKVGFIGN